MKFLSLPRVLTYPIEGWFFSRDLWYALNREAARIDLFHNSHARTRSQKIWDCSDLTQWCSAVSMRSERIILRPGKSCGSYRKRSSTVIHALARFSDIIFRENESHRDISVKCYQRYFRLVSLIWNQLLSSKNSEASEKYLTSEMSEGCMYK